MKRAGCEKAGPRRTPSRDLAFAVIVAQIASVVTKIAPIMMHVVLIGT